MPRVADLAAQTLYAHGVRHAFGMPGGEVVTFIDALENAGIRFILCRHETNAAIMAAGASVATGAPGLLVTTLGPGLTNAVNGIADASQEHVPLIAFSGVVEHGLRGRYTHQIIDQTALMQPLVKGSFELEQLGAAATMARAIRLAQRGSMGPVFVQLSPDTAAKSAPDSERIASPPRRLAAPVSADSEAVAEVAERLAKAKRPLIIAGLEAARDGCGEALQKLMERFGIPLITTYKAKGIVDEHHPLALGGAGLSPLADKQLLPLVKAADLVLLVGYDPIEMRPGWLDPFAADTDVIEISAAPADHGMHAATMLVETRPAGVLSAVLGKLPEGDTAKRWPKGEPAAARETLQAAFAPPADWGPHAIFDVLQNDLPAEATITADSGAHRILLSQQIRIRRPFGLMQSAGYCTMGPAIPLAAGVKVTNPDRPVVAVLGDGGLEMFLGELATLRDQNIPVIIVVLQDESLALIELKQAQAGLERRGVGLGPSKFEDAAAAFGGSGWRVKSRQELEAALAEASGNRNFSIIVCEIQVKDYAGKF
ncbi:MAG TPA: thiamine pyrophosphate-binding protein [Hyphomicrobiales bacterium]|nr:thiamine pyrophosphate-binding protein [Hyphomicrobiales bacterium]